MAKVRWAREAGTVWTPSSFCLPTSQRTAASHTPPQSSLNPRLAPLPGIHFRILAFLICAFLSTQLTALFRLSPLHSIPLIFFSLLKWRYTKKQELKGRESNVCLRAINSSFRNFFCIAPLFLFLPKYLQVHMLVFFVSLLTTPITENES